MKKIIIGKNIDDFARQNSNLPTYWGDKFLPPSGTWGNSPFKKINGAFIARKYNAILHIIEETKATVHLCRKNILIKYNNGFVKISRDTLTDAYLLPAINRTFGFNSIHADKIPFSLRAEYKEYLEETGKNITFKQWFDVVYWYDYLDTK